MSEGSDGIYSSATLLKFGRGVSPEDPGNLSPDQNVFAWYESWLPSLKNAHIIDWGAGLGRFVPLFKKHDPSWISLVEPSTAAIEQLKLKFDFDPNLSIHHSTIGETLPRLAPATRTFHFANFVLNCMPNPEDGLQKLALAMRPMEQVFIFTNVFAPKTLLHELDYSNPFQATRISFEKDHQTSSKKPSQTSFKNQFLRTEEILNDALHPIDRYHAAIGAPADSPWTVLNSFVMPPCGFRHLRTAEEDFGDYQFVVLALHLARR